MYKIIYSIKHSYPDDKIFFKKICNMPHTFISSKSHSEFLADKCQGPVFFLIGHIFYVTLKKPSYSPFEKEILRMPN